MLVGISALTDLIRGAGNQGSPVGCRFNRPDGGRRIMSQINTRFRPGQRSFEAWIGS